VSLNESHEEIDAYLTDGAPIDPQYNFKNREDFTLKPPDINKLVTGSKTSLVSGNDNSSPNESANQSPYNSPRKDEQKYGFNSASGYTEGEIQTTSKFTKASDNSLFYNGSRATNPDWQKSDYN
jgi:hypothetical protein